MSTMKWPLGSRESMHEAREEYWLACLDIDTLFRRAGWPPPPRTHRLQARRAEGDVRTQGIHAAAVQVDRRRAPRGFVAPAMRALSIRQPWLWAILHGGKTVENRDWSGCEYRGPILLHASKGCGKAEFEDAAGSIQYMRRDIGLGPIEVPALDLLPRGSLCGIARIVDVVRHPALFPGTGGNEANFTQGFRMCGALGLELADVRELPEIPFKGSLGFFAVALEDGAHKRVYEDAWRELTAASRMRRAAEEAAS